MKPIYTKNRTIGLLGGSFNPAHGGHLHITRYALNKLGCDAVWWLVSPKNPLKDAQSLASYEERLNMARQVAADTRIHVSDIEATHRLRYTYETVAFLKRRNPGTHFVWLMGADNLAQFHRWRRWQWLLSAMPIVVFDRAPYSHTALRSKAYLRGHRFLLKNSALKRPATAPNLMICHLRRDDTSASLIRNLLGNRAFLRHNKDAG